MPLPQENISTILDIYALPNGQHAELIDGELFMMSPPSTTHQRISRHIFTDISVYIRSKQGDCEVFAAPFAVFLNNDETLYLEPDISVICSKNKIDEKGCHGAPDWVVEIVSPSSRRMDFYTKLFKYRTAGVREYWIVDPSKKTILVYYFEGDLWAETNTFSDKVKVNIYDDLWIDLSEINI